MSATIACRLCGGEASLRFERTVLGRHRAGYYQCAACGMTQTQEPAWLDEAYAGAAIHPTDTGVLARNLGLRDTAGTLLHLSGVGEQPCLDYGAGYGIFVRLMRDAGFQFHWQDPMAENLLARGFEWREGLGRPFAVTAFEVLEHWVRPLEEFGKVAALGADLIITSTELHPGEAPAPDWPYLSVESGQHVSFYRRDTLARLGEACGYPFVRCGPFVQVFGRRPVPASRVWLALRLGRVLFPLLRRTRRSLTVADCERLRAERRGSGGAGA